MALAAPFAALAAVCSLLALAAAPAVADSCPNAQFRTSYSAYLPDCRAYELVSPADAEPTMNTYQPDYRNPEGVQASATGDRMGWFSWFNAADVPSFGHYFLSTRGSGGWSTVGVIPPQSTENADLCLPTIVFDSPDLSKALLADGPPSHNFVGLCGGDDPPLVAGEPQGYQNLFVRDNATGSYQLVNVTPAGVAPSFAWPLGASSDLSHVVFHEAAPLTPDAPTGDDLYEWAGGVARLVTYLPDGTPVQGSFPNPVGQFSNLTAGADYRNPVADDGSRVVFDASGNLYVRENPMAPQSPVSGGVCTVAADACTVQLDATHGGSGLGGGGQFMWASADGSEVFFSDDASAGLTADTVPGSGQNLYRYDLATGTLTDLTPAAQVGVGGVAGASGDGSYIYFEATGALSSGAAAGQPNLYLHHAGATTFLATLAQSTASIGSRPVDACDWTALCLTSRVSSNGRFIAFNSTESLTGYHNVPSDPTACDNNLPVQPSGAPCTEIYLYDAAAGKLSCVSCDPSGALPTGPTWIRDPTLQVTLNGGFPGYPQHNLSDSGQVFFDSPDALLPAASNGTQNVYEYENGQLQLLSSGTSSDPSFFFDATPSGNDVFIWTTQQLLAQQTTAGGSIYDARVDGGFPAPPTPAPPCSGDACRGSLGGAPPAPVAASVSFSALASTTPSAPAGSAAVLTQVVRGATFSLRVRVPAGGRITVSGAGVGRVGRSVPRAGTYAVKVTLTMAARGRLARGHGLRLKLRVGYAPPGAAARAATVALTVEPALIRRARHARRAATRTQGGAR